MLNTELFKVVNSKAREKKIKMDNKSKSLITPRVNKLLVPSIDSFFNKQI